MLPVLLKKVWDLRVSVRLVGLKLSHIYGSEFVQSFLWNQLVRKR